jgi:hypothetical protein
MDEEIRRQIVFALDDDNEVMTAGLDKGSGLSCENRQMNRELIKKHEAILAKVEKADRLTQEDFVLIRDANEIHLNDEDDLQGLHRQAVALHEWLEQRMEMSLSEAMRVLEEHLDGDHHTPAKVYRALHTLWEEATDDDVAEEPAFDKTGKCLKCGSKVSFADATDTVVFVADEIVKRHDGDITNRNCVKCTYPHQYPEYEDFDREAAD